MKNPFNLDDEKLKKLLNAYTEWRKKYPKEGKYATEEEQKGNTIRGYLLNREYLENVSNDDLAERVLQYSKTLEGPANIQLGRPRITSELEKIKRNLVSVISG